MRPRLRFTFFYGFGVPRATYINFFDFIAAGVNQVSCGGLKFFTFLVIVYYCYYYYYYYWEHCIHFDMLVPLKPKLG